MGKSAIHAAVVLYSLVAFAPTCDAQMVSVFSTTHGTVFPLQNEVFWRTVSSAIHLLGVSILAYCLARRTDKFSTRGLTSIPIAKWLALLIFADSWLFLFSAGLLISGVGLSLNEHACSAGIFLCIFLYALSKLLIYWFLVEKVHLVHPSHSRLKSSAYRLCILFVFGYLVIIILLVTGRIAFIRDGNQIGEGAVYDQGADGACVIGLGRTASLSILIYDLMLNVFFTCMFLYPVYKRRNLSPVLRAVARRTLIAALVSLCTSVINVAVLTALHGQELGWVCLASCAADVAVNALAIFAVTASFDDHSESERISTLHLQGDPRMGGMGMGGVVFLDSTTGQQQRLPIITRPGMSRVPPSPARGILEKRDREFQVADGVSSTRSIRFSPESTLQSRSVAAVMEGGEPCGGPFESVDQEKQGLVSPSLTSAPPTPYPNFQEHHNSTFRSELTGHVRISRLGRQDPSDPLHQPSRGRPFTAPAAHTPSRPPPIDLGEDTSVSVRHEGPISRKLPPPPPPPRRSGFTSPSTPMNPHRRSRSIEPTEGYGYGNGYGHGKGGFVIRDDSTASPSSHSASQTPSTLEEARERIRVLSALTRIAAGGGGAGAGAGAGGRRIVAAAAAAAGGQAGGRGELKVEVVMQIDRRVERADSPRRRGEGEGERDAYLRGALGTLHGRLGRELSSTGGL